MIIAVERTTTHAALRKSLTGRLLLDHHSKPAPVYRVLLTNLLPRYRQWATRQPHSLVAHVPVTRQQIGRCTEHTGACCLVAHFL